MQKWAPASPSRDCVFAWQGLKNSERASKPVFISMATEEGFLKFGSHVQHEKAGGEGAAFCFGVAYNLPPHFS